MTKFMKTSYWSLLALCVCLLTPLDARAMGISPVLFEANGLLANSSLSRTIYLTRSNPAEDEQGQVKVLGPAAAYIRLPNKGTVSMPKGQYNTPYEFFIEPGSLGKGDYVARIQVAPLVAQQGNSASGSMILTGAQAEIHFSVTTDAIENFEIGNPVIGQTEEGQVLAFTYQLSNKGNVDTSPTKIDVAVRDENDPTFAYQETVDKGQLQLVKAQSSATTDVPTKAALAPGSYVMSLDFFHGDQSVFKSRDLRFQVYPRGTLAQKGELQTFGADKVTYASGEVVAFRGSFKNTGAVGMATTLEISIYQDDTRLEVLSTKEFFVAAGGEQVFEKTYRPETSGHYTAVGVASFGPQRTDELRSDFDVGSKVQAWIILVPFSLLLVLLAAVIIWFLRRRKKNSQEPPNDSPGPSSDSPNFLQPS